MGSPKLKKESGFPLSLYVHYPWCIKKCPYCDFNSYDVSTSGSLEEIYIDSLLKEIVLLKESYPLLEKVEIQSIFFGGGTPSLMSEESLDKLLKGVFLNFKLSKGLDSEGLEITLEANPGSIAEPFYKSKLSSFKLSGVNRVSLGAQSFSDEKLKFLGRVHSSGDTELAVQNIKNSGIDNFNLDLIFGLKGETLDIWQEDLKKVISFNPKHISAYSLTIEPGTEFGRRASKGDILVEKDELTAQMYEQLQEKLDVAGFEQYEISNFSKPSFHSLHNSSYWSGRGYLGLGAGAHSFLPGELIEKGASSFGQRHWNTPSPTNYTKFINSGNLSVSRNEILTKTQAETEFFFLKLRARRGFSLEEYRKTFLTKKSEDKVKLSNLETLLSQFIKLGYMEKSKKPFLEDKERFYLSRKGFLLSDSLISEFSAIV